MTELFSADEQSVDTRVKVEIRDDQDDGELDLSVGGQTPLDESSNGNGNGSGNGNDTPNPLTLKDNEATNVNIIGGSSRNNFNISRDHGQGGRNQNNNVNPASSTGGRGRLDDGSDSGARANAAKVSGNSTNTNSGGGGMPTRTTTTLSSSLSLGNNTGSGNPVSVSSSSSSLPTTSGESGRDDKAVANSTCTTTPISSSTAQNINTKGVRGNSGLTSTSGTRCDRTSPARTTNVSSNCREIESYNFSKKGQGLNHTLVTHGQNQQICVDALENATRDDLLDACQRMKHFMETMQRKHQDELNHIKESEEKIRAQQLESSKRENVLVMRLTTKEQEVQEYAAQLNELKASMVPTTGILRSTLLDPAVNFIIQKMKTELEETKKKLEDTQNDLNAWKFTPDSNTGKRLMAKCRMLYQENEELGKMVSTGRLAKLETDLALQKSLTAELKKASSEMDDIVQELDEDVEGLQGTILTMQQQARNSAIAGSVGAGAGPGSQNSDSVAAALENKLSNSSSIRNTHNSEFGEGLVKVRLSDLCAQCRTSVSVVSPPEHEHRNASNVQTSAVDSRSPIPQVPTVEKNERTCVNGQVDDEIHSSKITSNQSVQNVVNLNAKANECDETDGGPPTSKRTKLHGDTAVPLIMNDHSHSSRTPEDTTSFNGNGSMEY